MTDGGIQTELDPKLEEWLADAREAEGAEAPPDVDAMFGEVEKQVQVADRSWAFWLRSRATWARRAIAFAAAAAVVVFGGVLTLRADFTELPLAWTLTALGSLAVLLGGSLYLALRPLHQPPLRPWARAALIGSSLAATCALALLAPAQAVVGDQSFLRHVSPCLFYGMLVGLPVYLLLRLLDRGAPRSPSSRPARAG